MRLIQIPIKEVVIPPERQRKGLGGEDEKKGKVSFEELMGSLRERGTLLNPIRIKPNNELIAGFRRIKAAEAIGWTEIAATVEDGDVDEIEYRLQELDENIQRLDLTWQERVRTIAEIDKLRKAKNPYWNQAATAAVAGTTQGKVSEAIKLVNISEIFPEVMGAKTKRQAESIAKQKAKTVIRKEEIKANPMLYKGVGERVKQGKTEELILTLESESIHHIVTDGPFGIGYDQRPAGVEGAHEAYEDSPESYRLRTSLLAPQMFRVLKPDAFLVWFLAHDHLDWTKELFKSAGFTVDPVPIVWDRSEGRTYSIRPDRWFGKGYDIALHCLKGDPQMQVRARDRGAHGKGNVFRYKPVSVADKDHMVERPPELYADIIECISVPGEIILDLFGGSGSVGAGAASKMRGHLTFELSPTHIPTIVTKIANYTPQISAMIQAKAAETKEKGGKK